MVLARILSDILPDSNDLELQVCSNWRNFAQKFEAGAYHFLLTSREYTERVDNIDDSEENW
jgi:hypothetical protein